MLSRIPGASLFLQSTQDLRIGGRSSGAQYQYTLQSDSVKELNQWAPQVLRSQFRINGVFFSDSLHGWAVGDNGTIRHTAHGGHL